MRVKRCMKKVIVTIPVTATIGDAANIFCQNHVGTLPVIDERGRLVGLLLLRDLIHLIMPAFVDLIDDIDYVGDFGAMEEYEPAEDDLMRPISEVMEDPISVLEDSGLVRAFSFIDKHQLLDLPVVNRERQLVGLASRVDMGRELLDAWWQCHPGNNS